MANILRRLSHYSICDKQKHKKLRAKTINCILAISQSDVLISLQLQQPEAKNVWPKVVNI